MAEGLFLSVVSRGVEAAYLICAVILVRILLKRVPKRILCILWMVVGLRLICPFDLESTFSLLPKEQSVFWTQEADDFTQAAADDGNKSNAYLENKNSMENTANIEKTKDNLISDEYAGNVKGTLDKVINVMTGIWIAGVIGMSAYFILCWYRVKKRVSTAIPAVFEEIAFYRCDCISSPFLFGIVSPKIYVPFSVTEQELSYVLRHEEAHKAWGDHWIKPVWYMLFVCYWFHPLVWASYILFCRDMELACDEKVVKDLGIGCKKAYSQSLLACAAEKKNENIAAYPVAFGEIGVKNRVKNILNYKKPAVFTILAAAAVCVIVTVCFATKPKGMSAQEMEPPDQNTIKNTISQVSSQNDTDANPSKAGSEEQAGSEENAGLKAESKIESKTESGGKKESRAGSEKQTGSKAGPEEHTESKAESEEEAGSKEQTGSEQDRLSDDDKEYADIVQHAAAWAEAFCSRDAEKAGSMLSAACRKEFLDGPSFGWSSPWPWESGVMGDEPNYRILSADDSTASILYYAWTSDPHVTVWHQVITYEYAGGKDEFLIDSIDLAYLDEISSADEFYLAYPGGMIKGTKMDYRSNGAYEALERNALLSSTNIYKTMSKPDTAAAWLLNFSKEVNMDIISNHDGEAIVKVTFLKDRSTVNVKMVQPAGENGIWIPQTEETFV